MKKNIFPKILKLNANKIVVICLLLLPYFVFNGGLFIGGDDTKLQYVYPYEYLKNISLFSWSNFANFGSYGPSQGSIPFLSLLSVVSVVAGSKSVSYLAYSLPFILGFLYFRKLMAELLPVKSGTNKTVTLLGALMYILSPIMVVNQWSVYLTPVWLVALFPIVSYYFLCYLKTGRKSNIVKNIFWCTLLSLALFTIPWMLGFILPAVIALILSFAFFSKTEIVKFIKKAVVFFGALVISQSFWVIPALMVFAKIDANNDSFVVTVLKSKDLAKSFEYTVLGTASGSIIFPLFNLFHRQIAFDFGWYLKTVYENFYDRYLILNSIHLILLVFGLSNFRKVLSPYEKRIFILLLTAFIFSLFFFTVNIGPLKQLFLLFGYIPAFVMFRNFYDKFALGYIFIFSMLTSFSLAVLARRYKNYNPLFVLFFIVTIVNFLPIYKMLNQPLWTTKNTYGDLNMPDEYTGFMSKIKENIPPTSYVLSLPLNIGSYSVITDEKGRIYAGSSLVIKILSGLNDLSGDLSFNQQQRDILFSSILNRDYKRLNQFLYDHNISYVFITNNISKEVKNSFLFNKHLLEKQDPEFISAITGKKILESSKGNYIMYSTKLPNSIIKSENIYFQKVNPTRYRIFIPKLEDSQVLDFLETYNGNWSLYLQPAPDKQWCKTETVKLKNRQLITECKPQYEGIRIRDVSYLFTGPVFAASHSPINPIGNRWIIKEKEVINNFNSNYYLKNADGSIGIELELYFTPQSYFYVGIIISVVVFSSIIILKYVTK